MEQGYDLTRNGVPGLVLQGIDHKELEKAIRAVVPNDPVKLREKTPHERLQDLIDFYQNNPKHTGMAKITRGFKIKLPKFKR